MSFREHVHELYYLKMKDVEEPIDLYWHRPLAAWVTAIGLLLRLPLTPNRLTLSSLIVGWLGNGAIYIACYQPELSPITWVGWPLGALLIVCSVVLDCADGQLARYRGGGTRMGRIFDGIVDALVAVPMYALMGFWVKATFGNGWFWFTVVVGVNQWLQITAYDRIKTIYLGRTQPSSADGNESREDVEADYATAMTSGSLSDKIGMIVYARLFLPVQDLMTPSKSEAVSQAADVDGFKATFGKKMRSASFLGLGTHMFVLYLSIALTPLWQEAFLGSQVLFFTLFNALFVAGMIASREMVDT